MITNISFNSKQNLFNYTLEITVDSHDGDLDLGSRKCVATVLKFLEENKVVSLIKKDGAVIQLTLVICDIEACLIGAQYIHVGRQPKVVAFIKLMSKLRVREFFEGVELEAKVEVCHNHTTQIIYPIGELARVSSKFSIKHKYAEILQYT